jgi:RHS repeat-associated protein
MATANPVRFSTKYQDDETGLLYYGYRYFNAVTGRWLCRDLLAERGGRNLYEFSKNQPTLRTDMLGLFDMTPGEPSINISGNTITIAEFTYGQWSGWSEQTSPARSVEWFKGAILFWTDCGCKVMKIFERFDNIYRFRRREVSEQETVITVSPRLEERQTEYILAVWSLGGHAVGIGIPSVTESIYAPLKQDHYSFSISHFSKQYYESEAYTFWRLTRAWTRTEGIVPIRKPL